MAYTTEVLNKTIMEIHMGTWKKRLRTECCKRPSNFGMSTRKPMVHTYIKMIKARIFHQGFLLIIQVYYQLLVGANVWQRHSPKPSILKILKQQLLNWQGWIIANKLMDEKGQCKKNAWQFFFASNFFTEILSKNCN